MARGSGTWFRPVAEDFLTLLKRFKALAMKKQKRKKRISRCYYAVLYIQLRNGLRISEAVDVFKRWLNGEEVEHIVAKKNGNKRPVIIDLPTSLRQELAYCMNIKPVNVEVFTQRTLDTNTHTLRHMFIHALEKLNLTPAQIVTLTGHKRIDTILHYTNKNKAMNVFKNLIAELEKNTG